MNSSISKRLPKISARVSLYIRKR